MSDEFEKGDRVHHRQYGPGTVKGHPDGDHLVPDHQTKVWFDDTPETTTKGVRTDDLHPLPEKAEELAETLGDAGVVTHTQPHSTGVYMWTKDGGYGFGYYPTEALDGPEQAPKNGNIRSFYNFRVCDIFVDEMLSDDHRHHREDATIFVNLVFEEYLADRHDAPHDNVVTIDDLAESDC